MGKNLGRRTIADRAADIAASKERLSEWPHGVRHIVRLQQLRDDIAVAADHTSSELVWYVPVALVSCIESFFKEAVGRMLDSGSPYLERIPGLKLQPLSIPDFNVLQEGKVSLGEFVAYQQSYSSLEAIGRLVSTIAECDFLVELKNTEERLPWNSSPLYPGPVMGDDPGRVFESIKECFRLRHLVCHEGPTPRESAPRARLESMHEAVQAVLSASFYFFTQRLLAHVPATHQERLAVRAREAEEAGQMLAQAYAALEAALPANRRALLAKAQETWLACSERDSALAASTFDGGLMEREEYFHYLAYMRRSRARELRRLLEQEV